MSIHGACGVPTLFLLALGAGAQSPAPQTIPNEPACPRCTIAVRTLVMVHAASARVGGGSEYLSRAVIYDKVYRTYVEVIDPRTARVVASHTTDGYVMEALPDRRAALSEVDKDGFPRVKIVALTLAGR